MDEQQVNNLIDQRINQYMNKKQYTYSKIPAHEHNGNDTIKINSKNIVYGINKQLAFYFYSEDPASTLRESFTFSFSNPKRLSFHGFIANNADGVPPFPTATKKAIVSGEALFGTAENLTAFDPIPVTTPDSDSIVQSSTSMYIDTTSLANTTVAMGNTYLAFANDNAGNLLASASCIDYSVNGITIEFYVSIGYYIVGTYLIS